jgi:mono/diheme cytochrome c family protein
VVFVPFDAKGMPKGDYETFADGFAGRDEVPQPSDARFRPTGVALGPDGSLYVTDSEKGRVWRIFYVGEEKKAGALASASDAGPNAAPVDEARGAELYQQACAPCHMPDGGGAPGLQPAIAKSALVSGEAPTLVTLLLRGPDAALPAGRPAYANRMPAFASWSDADVSAVLTFMRRSFGNNAGSITAREVSALRARP